MLGSRHFAIALGRSGTSMTSIACLGIGLVAACTHGPVSSGGSIPDRPIAFSPPASIGACRPDRLEVVDEVLDLGRPYRPVQYRSLEYAVSHHAHLVEGVIVLLVPTVDFHENVLSLEARRFEVATGRWLAPATTILARVPALSPRFTEVESGRVEGDVLVRFTDLARQTSVRRFSVREGTFTEASPSTQVPAFNGLATDAASPPDPDPTTGVSVVVSGEHRTATFTARDGRRMGEIRFRARPGSYVGAFASTRTAFLWNNQRDSDQRAVPESERYESYLIGLESGATRRIERELAFDATSMFRTPNALVMLNVLRTETERSDCPPGAPCVAPEQSHFDGVSVTTLRDAAVAQRR